MSLKPEISRLQLEIAESNEDEAARIRERIRRDLRGAKHDIEAGLPERAAQTMIEVAKDRAEARRLTAEARRIRNGEIEIGIHGLRL